MAESEPLQHTIEDLTIWRTALPEAQFACLPLHSDRPNPRLADGMLFASIFSSGCVYALDSATGEIRWRKDLLNLASCSVELAGGLLFAKTGCSLYALDPTSGKTHWEFSPYGAKNETLYSLPTVAGKRLYLGDRQGWFHCLDVDTGATIWKQDTPSQTNATAIVVGGLVITATNAGRALAFSTEDGSPVWQSELDGPCSKHLFLTGKQLVVAADSLHLLDPLTGESQGRVHWPGLRVTFAAGTPTQAVLFRGDSWEVWQKQDPQKRQTPSEETILAFEGAQLIREMRCSAYGSAARYSPQTKKLYVSGQKAIDILDPQTGHWLYTLRPASNESRAGYGLPDATQDRIYVMSAAGIVSALRHPIE
jgi:hypothetical protein